MRDALTIRKQALLRVAERPADQPPAIVRIAPFAIERPNENVPLPLRTTDRVVKLDGAANGRDLGFLTTNDGRQTKPGLMYRCGDLSQLSDVDLDALKRRDLRRVFDFRGPSEVAGAADRVPDGARWIAVAIHGDDDGDDAKLDRALRTSDVEAFEQLLGDGGAERMMLDAYRAIAVDAAPVFAKFFAELLASEGASLFHCAAGKDRTGVSAALFLRILDVPDKVIVGDFLLSNVFRAKEINGMIAALGDTFENAELLRPVLEVSSKNLKAAFDAIDEAYGDFATYVRDALGLDEAALTRLRDIYLEPPPADRASTQIGRARQ